MPDSLSRRLARFAASLDYDEIPPQVIDKAKTSLAHCLVMSFVGARTKAAQDVIEMTLRDEASEQGATLLTHGGRATRYGAAFANSFVMQATNQADSYHMLVHPGACVIPAVLVTAELDGVTGREALAALVAGTEVECRIAGDFLPATQARGFRSSSVYGTFGAAIGAARAKGLGEDAIHAALSWAGSFTAGLGEGAHAFHEANATRNGVLAASIGAQGFTGSERIIDGPAGFYNAFTGNAEGRLSYAFAGPKRIDLDVVASELGERWEMLHVTPKIPPTTGYAIPVIELLKELQQAHGLRHEDIESVEVLMNWMETTYPSPAFVDAVPGQAPRQGSTAHVAAYVLVHGDYPIVAPPREQLTAENVLGLMARIEVLGVWDRLPFAPRVTLRMRDGRTISGEHRGDELEWDFETGVGQLRRVMDQVGRPREQLEGIIEAVAALDGAPDVRGLLRLCV